MKQRWRSCWSLRMLYGSSSRFLNFCEAGRRGLTNIHGNLLIGWHKWRLSVHWQKWWHHVEPWILAAGHLTMLNASTPAAVAAPSASSSSPTPVLTFSILFVLLKHPIDDQDNDDEDNCGTSQCQMIKSDLEDILMCLRFDRFGLLDGAAIA